MPVIAEEKTNPSKNVDQKQGRVTGRNTKF
jgi:hypothetical protein